MEEREEQEMDGGAGVLLLFFSFWVLLVFFWCPGTEKKTNPEEHQIRRTLEAKKDTQKECRLPCPFLVLSFLSLREPDFELVFAAL